jgi:vacuolar-type H+-ATPase subunit E/Vma4
MADVSQIVEKILSDAKQEEKSILETAKRAAAEIIQEAENTAQSAYEEEIARAKKDAQAIADRNLSAIETEQRKVILSIKQQLLEECFREAVKTLNQMPQEEFMSFLEKKLTESSLKGEGVLILPKRYKVGRLNLMGLNVKLKGLKVSVSDDSDRQVEGGFILAVGLIEENYTFERLVEAAKDALMQQVTELLFT